MPIGRLGNSPSNSVPDLNELDSNPQSVANAIGESTQVGGIGHRAVQFIAGGLSKLSSGIRSVADSFANAVEARFSGSAKDNFAKLFSRGPRQIDTPPTTSSFRSYIDDSYAQINEGLENQTYGATSHYAQADDLIQSYESPYAALSDAHTRAPAEELRQESIYQNVSTRAEVDAEVYVAPDQLNDDYVEAAPEEIYSNLADIATESNYAQLSEITTGVAGNFRPDSTQPVDGTFYERVDSHSSPATKQALSFVKSVLDQHGAAGGKALSEAGIFRGKKVIGQVTPELFNDFQNKLRDIKSANVARASAGFAITPGQAKFERFNSENADSPVHAVLQKAVFAGSPRLANKVKLEFDQILGRGGSAASPAKIAQYVAESVVGEKFKEAFDAGRSDSPLHPLLAQSALANEPRAKIEQIKAGYDGALDQAAKDFAFRGGLDRPFNPEEFKDIAIATARETIERYTI